jgi:hypothetical protein
MRLIFKESIEYIHHLNPLALDHQILALVVEAEEHPNLVFREVGLFVVLGQVRRKMGDPCVQMISVDLKIVRQKKPEMAQEVLLTHN